MGDQQEVGDLHCTMEGCPPKVSPRGCAYIIMALALSVAIESIMFKTRNLSTMVSILIIRKMS